MERMCADKEKPIGLLSCKDKKGTNMQFSVLMSVYKNEKVEFFKQALDSVITQTLVPDEIILIRDGEVPEVLQNAIDEYLSKYPKLFTYIPLETNGGLGNALRIGVERAKNEIIARMDTDDICVPNRFEKQMRFMQDNPQVDIVGGNIAEFTDTPERIVDYRIVPSSHEEIEEFIKKRSPFNHMTVVFKKQSVLKANNYQSFYLFEDWYLWLRMYLQGCKFANLDEILVFARTTDMSARRGGWKYYKSCKKLLKFMKKNKIIGFFSYMKSSIIRFCGYVLIPNKLRAWCYKKFLRKDKENIG